MGSSFNPQILVEKLAKLNSSQASIETLSHWCIFHMNKAKYVVEVWSRQFHCSPREQRLAFLYLANDILQNSRRKGSEFVGEFWRVLPDAIRDVIQNGDEAGRTSALRLISIWDERKVFGSRGQILKEEFAGKHLEDNNKKERHVVSKLQKQPVANTVDRIVSGYQVVYGRHLDEDVIFSKCRNAMNLIEKADKEVGSNPTSGSSVLEEVQGQHVILRDCIEQLKTLESSRASLVSYLREALEDQELKLEQVQKELQVAQSRSEQAANICRQFPNPNDPQMVADQNSEENHAPSAPPSFNPTDREQSAPVMYTQQVPFHMKSGSVEEDYRKSTAAAVAAKLTASTSSAQMLSYVLSSLASEGVIGNAVKEPSGEYTPEKRPKFENDQQQYIPTQNLQRPLPSSFSQPESNQPNTSTTSQPLTQNEVPPPPSSPPQPPLPPMPHYPVPPYVQTSGSVNGVPYSYGIAQQQLSSLSGFPMFMPPMGGTPQFTIPLQNPFQGSEGFSSQPSTMPAAPVSRQ